MTESLALHMRHVRALCFNRSVFEHVQACYKRGVKEGSWPDDGTPPGDSSIVLAIQRNDASIAGFATYYQVDGKRLWLHVLWVEPGARRQGVATRLLAEVELAARRQRLKGLLLGHVETNAGMAAVMERTGWKVDHIVRARELRA